MVTVLVLLGLAAAPGTKASERTTAQELLDLILSPEEVAQLTTSGAIPGPASWGPMCSQEGNRTLCQRGYQRTVDEVFPGAYALSLFANSSTALAQFRGEIIFDQRGASSRVLPSGSETQSFVYSEEGGFQTVEALELVGRVLVRARCSGPQRRVAVDELASCSSRALDAQVQKLNRNFAVVVAPAPPTSVSAQLSRNRAEIAWTQSVSDGGDGRITYIATAEPGGLTCESASLSCVIAGITNRGNYSFTVQARNSGGTGPASRSVVGQRVLGPTSAVRGPRAAINRNGIRVTWQTPGRREGLRVLFYRVTSLDGSLECETARRSCQFTDVRPGRNYAFEVVAVNAAGDSPAALTRTIRAPRPVPQRPVAPRPLPETPRPIPEPPQPLPADKPAVPLS